MLSIDLLAVGAIGGLQVGDILVQLLFFLVLLAILKKFAWGPVMNKMEERENYVAGEIDAAEKNRAEAEQAQKEAQEQLDQVKQEAQKMMEEARATGEKQEKDIIAAARVEADRMKEQAQKDINNEKEQAVEALRGQVASLSVMIARKVIEKEISEQDQDKLIDEYIQELGEKR